MFNETNGCKWDHSLVVKHLIGRDRSPEAVQESMRAVAAEMRHHKFMADFMVQWGDEFDSCRDAEGSDALLSEMYDYCDDRMILVGGKEMEHSGEHANEGSSEFFTTV